MYAHLRRVVSRSTSQTGMPQAMNASSLDAHFAPAQVLDGDRADLYRDDVNAVGVIFHA